MGAHKTNPSSIMAATLPTLLPPGYRVGIDIQPRIVPQAHVLLMPLERIRTTEGKTEVLVGEPEAWQTPPEGAVVWPLGELLPRELCDVALMVATMVEDTTGPHVLVSPGQQPRGKVSMMVMAELARVPMVEWQGRHLGTLRGTVG
jgi:hypothetical protein